jgi:hypothetical protein
MIWQEQIQGFVEQKSAIGDTILLSLVLECLLQLIHQTKRAISDFASEDLFWELS